MIYALLLVLGLCSGSFVNAWVWRLREQELLGEKSAKGATKKNNQALSILRGRSMCVHCRSTLVWYDLMPIASWLSLGGKCRYCKKPISWQYPLVESATAVLFVLSYISFPMLLIPHSVFLFLLWLVFVVSFMALIVYDIRWMLLPNKIVFPLIALAVVYVALRALLSNDAVTVIASSLGGLLIVGGLFWVLFQVSGGKWIGGGDVKLGFVLGLLAGSPVLAFLIIFMASFFGTLFVLPQLAAGGVKASTKIPFGPFLILATIAVVLWGQSLVDWYLGSVL